MTTTPEELLSQARDALAALEAMAERYRPPGYSVPDAQKQARATLAAIDAHLKHSAPSGEPAEPVAHGLKQTFSRAEVIAAIEAERHACSIAVWMAMMDSQCEDADDLGLVGWMREAEARIKRRLVADPEAQAAPAPLPTDQCGWLVEWRWNGVQWLYLTGASFSFTSDPSKALRFARRVDADLAMAWAAEVDRRRGLRPTGEMLVTEHVWCGPSPQAAPAPQASAPSVEPGDKMPEALRLANALEGLQGRKSSKSACEAAAELRRLHAANEGQTRMNVTLVMENKELLRQLLTAQAAPAPQASAPSVAGLAEYTPGKWYEATTVDDMQRFYLSRLPAIRDAARAHGYAIGLHGSERRDFDMIAVPWRDGASDADTLAHAVAQAACGIDRAGAYQWESKPAGRIATSIPICWTAWHDMVGAGHIDLSVMAAPQAAPVPQAEAMTERDQFDLARWHQRLGELADAYYEAGRTNPARQRARAELMVHALDCATGWRARSAKAAHPAPAVAAERERWATAARLVVEATTEQLPMALDALADVLRA